MSKPKIHFLSASDRINYGDLLFPIIFKKVLETYNHTFYNYGIIKSSLTDFGALPTKSYKTFQKNIKKEGGNVVIGGGEVFFGNWRTLYSFINKFYAKLLRYNTFKKIENKLELAKNTLSNGKVLIPFVPSVNELGNDTVNVFFNAAGGRFYGSETDVLNQKIKTNLESASYISVRDQRTLNSLKDFGISSHLTPDSAMIMSDFFSKEFLLENSSFTRDSFPKRYVFVQIGISKSTNDLEGFAANLVKELEQLNCEAVLCPIGMAPNHDDQVVLKELVQYSSLFKLYIPKNIYEIMYLIAESSCYLGTSLHGLITAQSYNVPFAPLNKRVTKADWYCKTWADGVSNGCIDYKEINTLSTLVENWKHDLMSKKTKEQKELVYKNFDHIIKNFS